jgi:hypothetical protein
MTSAIPLSASFLSTTQHPAARCPLSATLKSANLSQMELRRGHDSLHNAVRNGSQSLEGEPSTNEANGGRKVHSEWRPDQILRAVGLPTEVDTAHVNASLKDGILIIDLPKAPHSKSMRVEPRPA